MGRVSRIKSLAILGTRPIPEQEASIAAVQKDPTSAVARLRIVGLYSSTILLLLNLTAVDLGIVADLGIIFFAGDTRVRHCGDILEAAFALGASREMIAVGRVPNRLRGVSDIGFEIVDIIKGLTLMTEACGECVAFTACACNGCTVFALVLSKLEKLFFLV